MKKTLWLSYAWADNEENDVDFVVQKLQSHGIEVRLDRTRIVAGQRLWPQIDNNILSSDLDGFAIYATKQSLESEPCQEEIVYALDRVLRTKGSSFPLIGIFPTPMDRELIPSAIATRLYVSLKDETWSSRVFDALSGQVNNTLNTTLDYFFKEHLNEDGFVYEMRPRDGVWHPALVAVPSDQFPSCGLPFVWAKGSPKYLPPMYFIADLDEQATQDGERWKGYRVDQQVDPTKSIYLRSKVRLRRIIFGNAARPQYLVDVLSL
ncbi:toll/interleukin-1 receptor domain-containing protein [Brucella pseudintermedia]|uniref:toll/interleukin-1 receptor domain-containing protein n=1 Tax=Brucella pseudintermedia TaxID=370111 RepID=UPI0030F45444